jgi:hypothetical protein
MAEQEIVDRLYRRLFGEPETRAYAILDGASIPELELPRVLWDMEPENICLYRGKLEPDLAATAPYLVALDRDAEFTRWVIEQGWGNHWGVFVLTPDTVELHVLRKHFRGFLMVRSPEGKLLYFRYYDPRVLRVYLPTCNEEEVRTLFGPVSAYVVEAEDPMGALVFRAEGKAVQEQVSLAPPASAT